jgi:hypothetical protein
MASDLRERVAAALVQQRWQQATGHPRLTDWCAETAEWREYGMQLADAALAAIREAFPPAAMGRAADAAAAYWDEGPPDEGWQSLELERSSEMLAALLRALAEEPSDAR